MEEDPDKKRKDGRKLSNISNNNPEYKNISYLALDDRKS